MAILFKIYVYLTGPVIWRHAPADIKNVYNWNIANHETLCFEEFEDDIVLSEIYTINIMFYHQKVHGTLLLYS